MKKENLYRIGLFASMSHLTIKNAAFLSKQGLTIACYGG